MGRHASQNKTVQEKWTSGGPPSPPPTIWRYAEGSLPFSPGECFRFPARALFRSESFSVGTRSRLRRTSPGKVSTGDSVRAQEPSSGGADRSPQCPAGAPAVPLSREGSVQISWTCAPDDPEGQRGQRHLEIVVGEGCPPPRHAFLPPLPLFRPLPLLPTESRHHPERSPGQVTYR